MQHENLWQRILSWTGALVAGHGDLDLQGRSFAASRPPTLRFDGTRIAPRMLLLTSGLGHGHTRAAQAIRTALLRRSPTATVRMVDWWSLMNDEVAARAQQMYLQLVQAHPELYERIYHLGERTWREMLSSNRSPPEAIMQLLRLIECMHVEPLRPSLGTYASDRMLFSMFCAGGEAKKRFIAAGGQAKLALVKWSWARLTRRMEALLTEFRPDVVVSTQMIPAALVSAVKYSGRVAVPSIAVPTDFGVHDFWRQPGTDLYCVGHERITDLPAGVDDSKVRVTGFPLMPEFSQPLEGGEARRCLGLQVVGAGPVILVLGGGLGLGVDRVAELLLRARTAAQLLVLPGENAAARARLETLAKRYPARMKVYEWTERTDLFIRAADLVVGKPGGLTVAEVLACGRPLLATRSLGGQEGFNARFLESHQVGRLVSDDDLVQQVEYWCARPLELAKLQKRVWRLGRRDGAGEIAGHALALAAGTDLHTQKKDTWHWG